MTTAQMNAVTNPATGLMVFNSDSVSYFFFDGSNWISIVDVGGNQSSYHEISHSSASFNTYGGSNYAGAADYSFSGDSLITVNNSSSYSEFIPNQDVLISISSAYTSSGSSSALSVFVNGAAIMTGSPKGSGSSLASVATTFYANSGNVITVGGEPYNGGNWLLKILAFTPGEATTFNNFNTIPSIDSVLFSGNDANGDSILNVGSIGIGTSSPNRPLFVYSETTTPVEIKRINTGQYSEGIRVLNDSMGPGDEIAYVLGKAPTTNNSAWLGYRHEGDDSDSNMVTLNVWNKKRILNVTGQRRVGINTLTPHAQLQVDSFIVIDGTPYQNARFMGFNAYNDGGGNLRYINDGGVDLFAYGPGFGGLYHWPSGTAGSVIPNDATTLFYLNDSTVTIGGVAEDSLLDVKGHAMIDSLTINGNYHFPRSAGSPGQALILGTGGNLEWSNGVGDNLGNHIATQNIETDSNWISNDGDNEGIYIDTSGWVGINTTTPVAGASFGFTDFEILTEYGNVGFAVAEPDSGIVIGTFVGTGSEGKAKSWLGSYSDHDLAFFTNNDMEQMVIQRNTGNVGIGNYNPEARLHVTGDNQLGLFESQTSWAAVDVLGASGESAIRLGDTSAIQSGIRWDPTTEAQHFFIFDGNANDPGIYQSKYGSVSINTSIIDTLHELYVHRPADGYDFGPGRTTIYGYRGGHAIEADGGASWYPEDVDAAIQGYSYWGNNYTAGVYGGNYGDYPHSAGVLGYMDDDENWGALAYHDSNGVYWGVYTPDGAYFGDQIQILDGTEGAGKVLISDSEGRASWQVAPSDSDWVVSGTDVYNITGNIGIGTGTPNQLLDIRSADTVNSAVAILGTSNQGHLLNLNSGNGSTDPYISWDQGDDFRFATNESSFTELMRITKAGDVGIGTSAPSEKFEVTGGLAKFDTIIVASTNPKAPLHINNPDWGWNGDLGDDGYFLINASSSSFGATRNRIGSWQGRNNIQMYASATGGNLRAYNYQSSTNLPLFLNGSGGNVGIGTTSPASLLHVNSTTTQSTIRLTHTASASNGLWLSSDNTQAYLINYENTSLKFATNGADRMTITNVGLVGIGTTSPSQKLQVLTGGSGVRVGSGNAGDVFLSRFADFGGTLTANAYSDGTTWNRVNTSYAAYMVDIGVSNDYIDFSRSAPAANPISNYVSLMRLSSNGNVGIGVTAPAEKLHISGNIRFEEDATATIYVEDQTTASVNGNSLHLEAGNGGTGGFGVSGGNVNFQAGDGYNAGGAGTGGHIQLIAGGNTLGNNSHGDIIMYTRNQTTNVERFRLDGTNGNVGIGTATPAYTMHVNGSVAGTSAYTNLSDRRFKTNLQSIDNALAKVMQLTPYSYDWLREEYPEINFEEGKGLGFIAQDVEAIIPEMVMKDSSGVYSLQYSELIPVLTKAIQEQQALIEELSSSNQTQQRELNELKAMLDAYLQQQDIDPKAIEQKSNNRAEKNETDL
ncbi:MAG: tail fiber domain-containing protein [Flavobacteriales bacterium]